MGVQDAGASLYRAGVCLLVSQECVGADGYVSTYVNYATCS